ncbi:hypothetical protein [Cryobacterium sp. PH31-L1]|uniref:hypothetical protein n=1 Tax=Cryobacterium sp. PH31-L1 TaxID=3046199 RepID=UPI0024BBADB5|nr:hypothetical protein [Cryobacterium sp. PH31-L1]MDJ0379142.1 hypothetical protein [Cryobacterium sp. PH31-L1]
MWMIATETPADLVPSWIEAIATLVGVVVALAAIVFTVVQLRLTSRQMRETAIQEAQNSEAQTRPYVGIDIVPGLAGAGSMDIIIENHGRTTARDIRMSLVGDTFRAQSDGDVIGEALGRLFATGFDLAPGARRRVFWQIPADKNSSPRGHMGTPVAAGIAIVYDWAPGDDRPVRNYADSIEYDLTEYPKLIPMPSIGATAQGASPETQSRNLLHVLRAIAANLAEIRR